MRKDKQDEAFIEYVCNKVQNTNSYFELDIMITNEVDDYGALNNLSLEEMDRIQNAIYKKINK